MLALGLVSCVVSLSDSLQRDAVTTRAKFDLECDKLDVVVLGDRTFGVTGCGKRATYVTTGPCGAGSSQCTAVMNTDEKPQ